MIKKILNFIIGKRDIIYILIISIISIFFINQCNNNSNLHHEVQRLENNIYALTDTLTQYVDDNGKMIAERHAFILTQKELEEEINLLKTKNREYLTYINTHIGLRDTIIIPTYIERHDTTSYSEEGIIKIDESNTFGKSKREVHVRIPYYYDGELFTEKAYLDIYHDIYVESMIERDTKTGETYVRLISDYPVVFNSGFGVVVTNSKSYEKSMRKTRGIGLGIGPSIGVGLDMSNRKLVPTVGINVTLGFTYTPKWLQW